MSYSNETELLDTILRVFPKASIVSKSKLTPAEIKKLKQGKRELPAREGARSAPRRAGKQAHAEESYYLFDLDGSGVAHD